MNSKPISYKPLIKSLLFLVLMILLGYILSASDYFVNTLYPDFYKVVYPTSTLIFGWVPFSVGDLFYLALVIYLIWSLYKITKFAVSNKKNRAIKRFAQLIYLVGAFILVFNVFWGFNYSRTNLIDRYNMPPYDIEELKWISSYLLKHSIKFREKVKEDQNGVFVFEMEDFTTSNQGKIYTREDIPFKIIPSNTKKKYSMFSWFMRYFGVTGYYNPFTAESQITYGIPDVSMPFTMAHEQAHQMGYAPEFEANYIGFVSCIESSDPAMIYSAKYKALKYVLRNIYPYDTAYVKATLDSFSPGMKRDYAAERKYYQKYAGAANDVFSSMNNLYLKANRQEKGVESYSQFVDLLVHYYRVKKLKIKP